MVRASSQRVLLIGDSQRELHGPLMQAMPSLNVTVVGDVFEAIAELNTTGPFTAVLAAVEPMERRPEAAVRTLRKLTGDGRLILFGHPTLELLSRKMLQFGCDDYVITPASGAELQHVISQPKLRIAEATAEDHAPDEPVAVSVAKQVASRTAEMLADLSLAELLLDAMLQHPHEAVAAAVRNADARLGGVLELRLTPHGKSLPASSDERPVLAQPLSAEEDKSPAISLALPKGDDEHAARHALAQFAHSVGKLSALQDRHNQLQRLAITDDLTGLYNGRYFRHFLARITEKARQMRFPVTLLLFDIDDFKKYNDQFGHGVGDEILKQTATMMRRCCRDHDLVARIGGDEFAVVFWDKEGPRQPRDPKATGSRPPQTPVQIFERFRRLMSNQQFEGLGASGRGTLGISAGLAVFPWDAQDVPGLIKKADERLMFGAKQGGKNSIYLVGGDELRPLD